MKSKKYKINIYILDGIIIFGTHIDPYYGGELIAVNPDGTERWRNLLAHDWIESAPAIGEDGTIYVGSVNDGYHPTSWGYLHAVGKLSPDAPTAPDVNGPSNPRLRIMYDYTFKSTSPVGRQLYYYVSWEEKVYTNWKGPFDSGEEFIVKHAFYEAGTYIIRARAKDTNNLWGPWGTLTVAIPRDKSTNNMLLQRILERFPLVWRVVSRLNVR